jgi:hypothetical protein
MGTVLLVVGLIWAVLGVGNIVGMDWTPGPAGMKHIQAIGLMLNMLLYVLPGLVVAGIGYGIRRRKDASVSDSAEAASQSAVNSRKCPFCAEIIKLEAKVCRYCGRDLPDHQDPRLAHEQERAEQDRAEVSVGMNPQTKIGAVLAIVGLLLSGALVGGFHYSGAIVLVIGTGLLAFGLWKKNQPE